MIEIDPTPLINKLIELEEEGASRADLAYTFQYIMGRAIGRAVLISTKGRRVSRLIPAGGGAIVNSVLVRGIKDELRGEDLGLLLPTRVPPNDGGIALGQVYSLVYIAGR
ncbi:MAG: hypothetical protein QW489_02085 [Sulfolobales archaeon]